MANNGLVVRRSERFDISLPARIRVGVHHIESVQFAKGVTDSERWIDVSICDFGLGGVGFITDLFLPRKLDLEIEIHDFNDQTESPLLKCSIKVSRVQMVDRRPGYLMGCSFKDLSDLDNQIIQELVERLNGSSSEDQGESYA